MLGRLRKIQDLAPLVLRVVIGAVGIYHGHPKLFGGMGKFVQTVEALGMPGALAWAAAIAEFVGGIFLILGLFTRWAALLFMITMAVAVAKVHFHQGFGEYEYPLVLATAAFSILFTGGGWLSIDRTLLKKEF